MSKGKAFRPVDWHALENRVALSHAAAPHTPAHVPADQSHVAHHHKVHIRLAGTLRGSATTTIALPDAGQTVALNGTGWMRPLDQVNATGSLVEPGFVQNGRDHGTLTLSNNAGDVTIEFQRTVGLRSRNSSGDEFTFSIVSGTGAYQYAVGNGKMTLRTRGTLPSDDANSTPPGAFVLSLNHPLS